MTEDTIAPLFHDRKDIVLLSWREGLPLYTKYTYKSQAKRIIIIIVGESEYILQLVDAIRLKRQKMKKKRVNVASASAATERKGA